LKAATNPSDDYSKTTQRVHYKKTNLNQQHRKEVVVAVVVATRSPGWLQQSKQKNS